MPKELTGLSKVIHEERYAHDGETWADTCKRVADYVSMAENGDKAEWAETFRVMMEEQTFIPGGRILANAGRVGGQLLNCFVLPVDDNRESIGDLIKEVLVVSGTGGGIGISFKNLRYRGAKIVRAGGTSSGSVSFMNVVDAVAATIKTGGGRRAALMLSLPVDHPDIEEFLKHKLDLNNLTNANVSVEINNDFIDAVKRDRDWDLVWAGQVVKTVKARKLWNKVCKNAVKCGEPGILNLELMEEKSNSYYYAKILATNPCGEQPLPAYSACCLGSVNINNFVKNGRIEEAPFKRAIVAAIRFLDDVLTVNTYPLDAIKSTVTAERRIGLGLMGIHSAMLQMGIKYSSREGLEFVEWVYKTLRDESYKASCALAAEKGAFGLFEVEAFLDSGFVKGLPIGVKRKIRESGMRNVTVNTAAPTGTTAMLCGVSSGIEPIFAPVYKRTFFSDKGDEGGRKSEIVVDVEVQKALEGGKSFAELEHFEGAYDVPVEQHFRVQETVQRCLDSATSKTINVPKGFDYEELERLMLKYAKTLKGTTVYMAGSREHEPLQPVEFTEANLKKAIRKAEREAREDCADGSCEV